MPLALPALLYLCALIVAFGLITGGKAFIDALLAIVKKATKAIPLGGFLIGSLSEWALQKLSNKMGELANSLGADIADSWHFLATVIDRTGWAIYHAAESASLLYWHVAVQFPLDQLWKRAQDAYHLASRGVHAVGRTVETTIVQKADLTGLKKWVLAQLAAIPHIVAHAGAIAIPIPHSPLADLTGAWHRLTRRVSKLEARFGRKAFAASVATALAALGVGWARKACAKRTADGFCRVDPDVFASLIGGLLLIFSNVSLINLTKGVQSITDESVAAARAFITEAIVEDGKPRPEKGLDAFNRSTVL